MTASLPGVFNVQQFTDAGLPAAGYRLYTYSPGTTTQKVAYTDAAASVPHTYTSDGLGGLYIGLNARGELPAPLFLTAGGYDLCLKTSAGATVWTRRAYGTDEGVATLTADNISYTDSGTGAQAWSLQDRLEAGDINVFDYLTAAQRTAVLAYSFTTDVTAGVQAALNAAWTANRNCFAPAGGYLVTGLTLPGNSAGRKKGFRFYGQGFGELFALVQGTGPVAGTVLYSTTNAPVLQYVQDSPNTGGGNVEIDHICFYQANAAATATVVSLESLYSQSNFHHNAIYQGGTGDGFWSELIGTAEVWMNYCINKDWLTNGLGASRTGCGFKIQPAIDFGLTILRRNTSRGFKDGYILGGAAGRPISFLVQSCESSVTYNGISISSGALKCVLDSNYFEGGDGGVGVSDSGDSTTITNNTIFAGYGTGVDASSTGNIGTVIKSNIVSAASVANSKLIKIGSTGANGGPVKVARDNYLSFSGSGGVIAGVVGIEVTGIDPRVDFASNAFNPRGPWVGGAGTIKINDLSTTSSGPGRGCYGWGVVENGNQEFPALHRGFISLGVPETALTDANISAGTLTTGKTSFALLTCPGAAVVDVSAFAAMQEGTLLRLHITNQFTRLVHGANLKLSGSANFTPGANGSMHTLLFRGISGGLPVGWEVSRIAY